MATPSLAVLEARLEEAETAQHDLNLGQKAVVVVDQNGERVEFQRASPGRLQSYINDLKRQIAVCKGERPLAGPIWVWGT